MPATISVQEGLNRERIQLDRWATERLLQLKIAMDYSEPFTRSDHAAVLGTAGLRWSVLSSKVAQIEDRMRAVLAAFLYAKILNIDPASRPGLFGRVQDSTRRIGNFGPRPDSLTPFVNWDLLIAKNERQVVWPWQIVSWEEVLARQQFAYVDLGDRSVSAFKIYVAELLEGPVTDAAPDGWWLSLSGPDGHFERVLLPSVALLVLSETLRSASGSDQTLMLELLKGVNQYHERPEKIEFGREALAVGFALRKMADPAKEQPSPEAPTRFGEVLDRLIEWLRAMDRTAAVKAGRRVMLVVGVALFAINILPDTFRGSYYWTSASKLFVGLATALITLSILLKPRGESL